MLATTLATAESPRISLNPLGEFPFVSLARKTEMLTDQRFGNEIKAPYYQSASSCILRAFDGTRFQHAEISSTIERLRRTPPRGGQHAAKLANNIQMLEKFLKFGGEVVPHGGSHGIVRRNAQIQIDGVTISVRPEMITRDLRWTPKVGQVGSLTQTQENDPHVEETSSAQCPVQSPGRS